MGLPGAPAALAEPAGAPASSGTPGMTGGIRPVQPVPKASQNLDLPAESTPAESVVCSASVTYGGAALNIIWTAGHCVANGGHAAFYTNWLFCPSYKDGVSPIGCWSWLFATTSWEWFYNGSLPRDYAIIGLQHLGTAVRADVALFTGGLGFARNWPRDQNWVHLGYPAQSPYNGLRIIYTGTEHRYDDAQQGSPPTNSWGSPQTPGSSGSPLILFFTYASGFINSDVSYYYVSQAFFELQGPYFDSEVCNFWKSNTGYTGGC